ncbi:MAG: ATP-dependent DNA helicase RecG, partial [Clostridia bacterium]|nr:ATP-dependent DNA helicase RecG [Clostridia bacterium]
IIKAKSLYHRGEAVKILHDPAGKDELERAKRTLAIESLSVFRLALSGLRKNSLSEKAVPLTLKGAGIKRFFDGLPFTLTGAQQRAVKEIFADLGKPVPMARLLQGDVGSGKTAVAAAAIYLCVKNGYQACLMAPTEILAAQHKKTLDRFLAPHGIKTGLLTSGLPAAQKRDMREKLANGEIDVAIGTHALITDGTQLFNCALVVTDEQHRFGVAQRSTLLDKSERDGRRAHMLVMSATPIPRSLSLIIYGDLDVSLLDELPPGRQKTETRIVKEKDLEGVYEFIKNEIAEGGRAYIVCPLVEDSESSDRKSAETAFADLTSGALKGIPAGLIHGRMKPSEKEAAMADFAAGITKILVSTTVIEVGVDVPEATVMLIRNAESFGLSQLHQLRGRIGRGSRRSVCILVDGGDHTDGSDRLRVMRDTSDGFKVAEADLQRRGPGDFFGERQSGEFSAAFSAITDMSLIAETDATAEEIRAHRGDPEYAEIYKAAAEFLKRSGGSKTVN